MTPGLWTAIHLKMESLWPVLAGMHVAMQSNAVPCDPGKQHAAQSNGMQGSE